MSKVHTLYHFDPYWQEMTCRREKNSKAKDMGIYYSDKESAMLDSGFYVKTFPCLCYVPVMNRTTRQRKKPFDGELLSTV